MKGRTRYVEAEPCTINADVIASLLRRLGWESAADFVLEQGRRDTEKNKEAMRWQKAYEEVLARLHRHEPPTREPARVSCKPDWTCDG